MIIHGKYGFKTRTPYQENFANYSKDEIIKKLITVIVVGKKYDLITDQTRFEIPLSRAPWVEFKVVGIAKKTGRAISVRVEGEEENIIVNWGHYNARQWCDNMITHLSSELRKVFLKLKMTRKEAREKHPELEWQVIYGW